MTGGTFTAAEKAVLNELLVEARTRGDDRAFAALVKLAKDPAECRKVLAGVTNK